MKCILHIGTEKTGTTTLQRWLYSNEIELSKQGVYLSKILGRPNNRLLVAFFQDSYDDWYLLKNIKNNQEKNAYFKTFLSDLANEIRAASKNHHTMLISSEHFHSRLRQPELIKQLRKFLDQHFEETKVICYFREQSSMSRSLYSTAIKGSLNISLQEFRKNMLNDYYYNFYEIANRWSNEFGRSKCTFRIFEKKYIVQDDIRKDFLNCLGDSISFDSLDNTISQLNESLSYFQLELFKTINSAIPLFDNQTARVDNRNILLKSIVTKCEALSTKYRSAIDLSEDSKIYDEFREINWLLFNQYFEGKYLFDRPSSVISDLSYNSTQVAMILSDLLKNLVEAGVNIQEK